MTTEQEIVERMMGDLFIQQREFINDTSLRKTLLCPRRSGKTFAVVTYLVSTCLLNPRSRCIFLALTKGTAKQILWDTANTGLLDVDAKYELDLKFNHTHLTVDFPNGSRLLLAGVDGRRDIEKLRGQAFKLVCLDECKSIPRETMRDLVEKIIGPALKDYGGTMTLMGTPGAILSGVFYEATRKGSTIARPWADRGSWGNKPFVWSAHQWSVRDNVAMPHIWEAALADKAAYGWLDDDPTWQREWIGNWVPDTDNLVFAYDDEHHSWDQDELPYDYQWNYMLGVHLGNDGDFALEVAAHSDECPILHQVMDRKITAASVNDIAKAIHEAEKEFGEFDIIVGNRPAGGSLIFNTLDWHYGIRIEKAKVVEQRDLIELLNNDFKSALVRLRKGSHLASEMTRLQWDSDRKDFHPECDSQACKAFLYLWEYSSHVTARSPEMGPKPGTPEYLNMLAEQVRYEAIDRRRNEVVLDYFEEMGQGLDDEVGGELDDFFGD